MKLSFDFIYCTNDGNAVSTITTFVVFKFQNTSNTIRFQIHQTGNPYCEPM
jgi:hypothetical protein